MSASHWFVKVGSHLLRPDGVHYQVTYAQLNILLWMTGDFGDGSVVNYPWTQVGVEVKYVEDVVRIALESGVLEAFTRPHEWSHLCHLLRRALLGCPAPRPNVVVAAHIRQLQLKLQQVGGGGALAAFVASAQDRARGEYLEHMNVRQVLPTMY